MCAARVLLPFEFTVHYRASKGGLFSRNLPAQRTVGTTAAANYDSAFENVTQMYKSVIDSIERIVMKQKWGPKDSPGITRYIYSKDNTDAGPPVVERLTPSQLLALRLKEADKAIAAKSAPTLPKPHVPPAPPPAPVVVGIEAVEGIVFYEPVSHEPVVDIGVETFYVKERDEK